MTNDDIKKLLNDNNVEHKVKEFDGIKTTIWVINNTRIALGQKAFSIYEDAVYTQFDKRLLPTKTNITDYIIFSVDSKDKSYMVESYIICLKCDSFSTLIKSSTGDGNATTVRITKTYKKDVKEKCKSKENKFPVETAQSTGFCINLGNDKSKQFEVLRNYFSNIDDNETNRTGDSKMENKTISMIADEIENKHTKQLILTGAPGTGKTHSAREYAKEQALYTYLEDNHFTEGLSKDEKEGIYLRYIKFVQFHSSYSYTDFVEGLRPVMLDNQVSFVRMDGVFKEFCRSVVENGDEDHQYFFIIDEINRADLSKVFGELMFGLEDDYRGEKNIFDTQYKNLPTYHYVKQEDGTKKAEVIDNDVFADGFYIPENVIIIGTMNDIDRSVEAFDFALRRRFRWINVRANDIMEDSLKGILLRSGEAETENKGMEESEIKELAQAAKKLNETISEAGESLGLNDDYHIGPAYYKHFTSKTKKEEYFNSYLEPILREYVRGRKPEKIEAFITACKTSFSSELPAAAAQSSEQSNKR